MKAKLCGANYKARVASVRMLSFPLRQTPVQTVYRTDCFSIIVFKNGNARIMGARCTITQSMIDNISLPFKLELGPLQSCTWTVDLEMGYINLLRLHNLLGSRKAMYEPELFPALRLTCYRPLCINIFCSGKCTILGYKSTEKLDQTLLEEIKSLCSLVQ